MVRFDTIIFCACVAVTFSGVTVSGFQFGGPCDVHPKYKGGIPDNPNFSTEVQVPILCRNGTFRWHHPRGHALVKFINKPRKPTSICVRDLIDGRAFRIIDTTDNEVVGPLNYDDWACTTTTNKPMIILRVNAPEEIRYIGQVQFKLRH